MKLKGAKLAKGSILSYNGPVLRHVDAIYGIIMSFFWQTESRITLW